MSTQRLVLIFTKPVQAGRVKTRLIGELSADEAAELHGALLGDLLECLEHGPFDLRIAWALEEGEPIPQTPRGGPSGLRQFGVSLGERLYDGLSVAAETHEYVAAVGSDHPELELSTVVSCFQRLESRSQVVLGPAADGGYYLIGFRRDSLFPDLFEGIPWSTSRVLQSTLERCRARGLEVELLPRGRDVDTPEDLARLAASLGTGGVESPRTSALLESWGRLGTG